MNIKVADILALETTSILGQAVERITGSPISHVGLVVSADPVLIEQAVWRVDTVPISETLKKSEKGYILSNQALSQRDREGIVITATKFSAHGYNYADIILQALNAGFRTTWFTDHLSLGLSKWPICSYLVADSYVGVGIHFGKSELESVTPRDIYDWCKQDKNWTITEIK
jgi:hypothetical protein